MTVLCADRLFCFGFRYRGGREYQYTLSLYSTKDKSTNDGISHTVSVRKSVHETLLSAAAIVFHAIEGL